MSRRLLATLFYEMSAIGWHIFGRANLTNRVSKVSDGSAHPQGDDKDTLIFKSGPKQQRFYFPIAFTEGDKIRIYDSPSQQVTNAMLEAAKVGDRLSGAHESVMALWYPGPTRTPSWDLHYKVQRDPLELAAASRGHRIKGHRLRGPSTVGGARL